ncbi:uncharacterized protein [Spinacia oleracea]|uniref:Uncharacterized protein n=1 Tax=Spinacia oleracea TaxID=3562 RepID=A0ABM3QJD7_SPIOL|nr:uncharacterized protein LOC130459870 [Spinacia oleracea]
MLADQLGNVGAPVSDQRKVLTLVAGLNEAYGGVATLIQHSNPLVSFSKARSMLVLEESNLGKQAAREAALIVGANPPDDPAAPARAPATNNNNRNNNNNRRNGGGRGRGNNNNYKGRGGGGRGRGSNSSQQQAQTQPPQWPPGWQYPPWAGWSPQPWATPPCPYPTTWQPRPPHNKQPGILGARPPQAYQTSVSQGNGYAPTDIEAALHTLSLNPPDDNWYMDTGATSHMTSNPGFTDGEATNEV